MKFINLCGFGLSGCTSQVDFLLNYQSVKGVLSPSERDLDMLCAPCNEFGLLKCNHSFGGLLIKKLKGDVDNFDKKVLCESIKGLLGTKFEGLSYGEILHLNNRVLLAKEYGGEYYHAVDKSVGSLPDNLLNLPLLEIIEYLKEAVAIWCKEVAIIQNSLDSTIDVLVFKNDPPGVFPLLSTLIPDGLTSAILRDPRDVTFDFNRCYQKENTIENVEWHCRHFNWHIDNARQQIEKYFDLIVNHYFVHDFESFVQSPSHRDKYLGKMCGRRDKVHEYFNPEKSIKNIGIYKEQPKELVDIIEKQSMQKYLGFRMFLEDRGLFLS